MRHPRRWLVAALVLIGLVATVLFVVVPAAERRVGDDIAAELERIQARGAPVVLVPPPPPPVDEDGWSTLRPLLAALQAPEDWAAANAPGSPLVAWVQGTGPAPTDAETFAAFAPWLAEEQATLEGIAQAVTHERWRLLGSSARDRAASFPFVRVLEAGQALAAWSSLAANEEHWDEAVRAVEALFRLGRTIHPQPLLLQFGVWSDLQSKACRVTAELAREAPPEVDLARLRPYLEPGRARSELIVSLRNERAGFLEVLGVLDERGELLRPVASRNDELGLGWWLLHSIQLRGALRGMNDLLERIEDAPDLAKLSVSAPAPGRLRGLLPSWYAAAAPAYVSMLESAQHVEREAEAARAALDARDATSD